MIGPIKLYLNGGNIMGTMDDQVEMSLEVIDLQIDDLEEKKRDALRKRDIKLAESYEGQIRILRNEQRTLRSSVYSEIVNSGRPIMK